MKKSIILFVLLLFVLQTAYMQQLINYDFQTDLSPWYASGNVTATWINQGANTPGAAQIEVLSTGGNIADARFSINYQSLPAGYENKILMIKVYAKSDGFNSLSIRAKIKNSDGSWRVAVTQYDLTDTFEKYAFPVKIKPGDYEFRYDLHFGTATGIYTFDDISLEYSPYDINDVQLFEQQVDHNFDYDTNAVVQNLNTGNTPVQIAIDTSQVIAPVLATQIGVNSNFRSKNSIVSRSHLYKCFGALRYPAGSGSDMYYWDGNIPPNINGYSGTSWRFLNQNKFMQLLDSTNGQASVVVNYAYARLGDTPQGTREARVSQAAAYAAGFVKHLNYDFTGHVKYWEVGNENYGSWEAGYDNGISILTGKEYGEDFRVYADSMKIADPSIKIGAVLSNNGYNWDMQVLKEVGDKADYFIVHHYFGDAGDINTVKKAVEAIENDVINMSLLAKEYTSKPFGYFPVHFTEYNSNGDNTLTMANGLFTANMIAAFIKSRTNLATIWVNEWRINSGSTHGIISKSDSNQTDYTPRPSYAPYYYFPKYFGNEMVQCDVSGDDNVIAYASVFPSGETGIVVINYGDTDKEISLNFNAANDYDTAYWYEIYADDINQGNTKFYVNGQTSQTTGGGPEDFDTVVPYRADYQSGNTFIIRKYSLNFITIGNLPVTNIISQPADVSACLNDAVSFEVQAEGQHLTYQWQKDGVNLTGETNSILRLNAVTTNDEADYTCEVSGDFGNLVSNAAGLQILPQTTIDAQPVAQTVNEGSTASFTVSATGSNLTYQWQKDMVDIAGATSNTLVINNVQMSDAGNYQVIVTGDCGAETSQQAGLNVIAGIDELTQNKIKIYPNPSEGKFIIEILNPSQNTFVKMYDFTGKIILTKVLRNTENTIDINRLSAGLYLLQVIDNEKIINANIVKSK